MAAAASDLEWRVGEVTKCPICLDGCKNPKSLPCLHSFCLHCLQQHWKDKCPRDEVPCPVCRKELAIPDEGLEELPHNFFVQNLIEAREAFTEQPAVMSCESCEKYCDETERNIPEATIYCVDCSEKLCNRCSRVHRTMKGGPHQVKELGAEMRMELIQQRGSYCGQHGAKLLEFYCFDCNVNICRDCFADEHTQHKCGIVRKVAQDFADSSKEDVQQVSSRISEFRAAMMQTDEGENELMRAIYDVDASVKQKGETLRNMVDIQVNVLLRQLQTFQRASQKEVAGHRDGLELGIVAMESFTAYSRELMSKGSACDITRAAGGLHARADELLKTYVSPADYCAPLVKFVPMNIDELTGSHGGDQNVIGRVLTSDIDGKLH